MNQKTFVERLESANLKYEIMPIGQGYEILIMERGGRIFGPFTGEVEGLFWVSDVIRTDASLRAFLESGDWNIGGDRIWIAPEIQFSITDRYRFWETLKTPMSIDPGTYAMKKGVLSVSLEEELELAANVIASGNIKLKLSRKIRPAVNPLQAQDDRDNLMKGMDYMGYEQLLTLCSKGDEGVTAQCWNLLQVIPFGYVYIPMYEAERGVNYYEPVDKLEKKLAKGVELKVTGNQRYKVGYKAAVCAGRIGYATTWNHTPCLLIRNFPNNPSNIYAEEPPLLPGKNGYSVHVYNDDGHSGGFAEVECNLQSVGKPTGYDYVMDRVSTWIFIGDQDKLDRIAKRLIGFDKLHYGMENEV